MKALVLVPWIAVEVAFAPCATADAGREASGILEGDGWSPAQSPYALLPGQTIAVCDTGVKAGVAQLVVDAVRLWLQKGGRDERLAVELGCGGDRVVRLVAAPPDVPWYGRTRPLVGKVHEIEVAPHWAGRWTANHEVGHVFGFAHTFSEISIMNSAANGRYMNGGELSAYDESVVWRLLRRLDFATANRAWGSDDAASVVPQPPPPGPAACTGVNGVRYDHGTLTTYRGWYYTCEDGRWSNDGPVEGQKTVRRSCTGVDGRTYRGGVVTLYRGDRFTCRDSGWVRES